MSSSLFSQPIHIILHNFRKSLIKWIDCFPFLEKDIRILRRSPENRMIRVQRPIPEFLQCFPVQQFLQDSRLNHFYFLYFMGCTETVKKVDKREPPLQCAQMGQTSQIHTLLYIS